MKASPHYNCCCDECVAARRSLVLRTHPIHSKKGEEPMPSRIPADQALAMILESIECYELRLIDLYRERDILKEIV
jgi:hypothetical protein